MDELSGQPMSAAQRRRQRRLRSMLRHEQQSIRMALATVMHHSYKVHTEYGAPRSQNTATRARGGGEVDEMKYTAKFRKTPPPQAFFQLYDEEDAVWGLRPACLAEPRGPQERVQLRTVEHIADVVPMVQILDAPVPRVGEQGVDQLVEAFRHLDLLIPEQVIEVPMISSSRRRCRRRRLPVQQMAEQLVEVPEFVSVAHAILRQIADIPIPQVGCLSGGVQGFLPGQDYFVFLEQNVDIPVPQGRWRDGGGLQRFLPVQNSTAFCGADHQFVDFPARGGLQGPLPGQSSSASSSGLHDCADDGIQGVFRTFSPAQQSATTRPEFSAPLGAQSSSWTPTAYELEHLVREDGEDDSNWFTDEFGRNWARLGTIPGRWYLCGNRASGVIFWDEDT